jgi:hypothetical protein
MQVSPLLGTVAIVMKAYEKEEKKKNTQLLHYACVRDVEPSGVLKREMPERNTRNQRDTRRDVTKEHHGPIVV